MNNKIEKNNNNKNDNLNLNLNGSINNSSNNQSKISNKTNGLNSNNGGRSHYSNKDVSQLTTGIRNASVGRLVNVNQRFERPWLNYDSQNWKGNRHLPINDSSAVNKKPMRPRGVTRYVKNSTDYEFKNKNTKRVMF